MVLVSYPERVVHGVICRPGVLRDVPGDNKKAGHCPLVHQVFLSLGATKAGFRHPGDQVEGKTPKALARATACVRLWASSLP
jgi:hypothetical protein